ncbi:MAG: hypothetical protein MUE60_14685 [Candidatus Eisenbacteria bacterium]|nr:hypothetical protein [Candidatus Eisenbacteria bacterium]
MTGEVDRTARWRRGFLTLVCAFAVAAALVVYTRIKWIAPSEALSPRRWDKVWQLVLLTPAVVATALGISLWIRADVGHSLLRLSQWFTGRRLVLIGFSLLTFTAYVPLGHTPKSKDEAQYVFQGRLLMSGRLWAPAPPCPAAFELRGLRVTGDRWVPAYDPGHSLLIGLADRLGLAWLVGPILGAVALCLLGVLGTDRYGPVMARGTLALGVLSPLFILLAASFSYHVTSLCLTTMALIATGRRPRGIAWDYAVGVSLGALVLVRPLALAILLLPLAYLELATRNRPWREWLKSLGRTAAALTPFLVLYLLYNRTVTGNPFISGRQFVYPTSLFGFGPQPSHAETYGPLVHTPLKGLLNVMLQFSTLSTGLFGWPLLSLVPAAVGFLCLRKGPWERAFVLMVGATAAILFFSWYSAVEHGPRHYLDAWPGLMLLSAAGLRESHRWVRRHRGIRGSNTALLSIAGLFLLSWVTYLPVRLGDVTGPLLGVDPVIREVSSVAARAPAVVFMDYPDDPGDYYCSGFIQNDPFLRAPVLFARHRSLDEDLACMAHFPGRNPYLLRYNPSTRSATIEALAQ